ncbi:hypothetical protein [Bifidobacterium biavatii]|nr:hypothetical protein [Bifidobacterium biavatii]
MMDYGVPMTMDDKLTDLLYTLQEGLRTGDLHHLEQAMLNPRMLLDVITPEEYDGLNTAMNREALLCQLDATARFCLEILNTALVSQGENGFLRPITDEMNGLGKFPHLRILRALLDPSGDARARGDVVQRVLQQLTLRGNHDTSPLNWHRALYTMLDNILGEDGGGSFSAATSPIPNNKKAER